MYDKNINQPQNLSAEEWELLQYLSTCSEAFFLADVFKSYEDTSESEVENVSLRFTRQFQHLKNVGYLAIIPMAPSAITSSTRPTYKLSAIGHKATQQTATRVA